MGDGAGHVGPQVAMLVVHGEAALAGQVQPAFAERMIAVFSQVE
jgi:hypothetical protein